MMFNCGKFEALRYGNDAAIKSMHHYLSSNGAEIEECSHVKDLGITISADATFTQHIYNICDAANQMVGWTLRTFETRHRHPMLTLWKSLILPKLDYCSQL